MFFVIDALRFDMAQKSTNDFQYTNKLLLLDETANTHPDRTRLYRFVADAPTTTSQRLKALMTGGLPTFIDMGKNFDSDEVQEDSLVQQFRDNSRVVVALGDDTWASLFPTANNYYKRHYFYPSFDVMDLHTVDNGILKDLDKEMAATDTQLLITHFLGVDHAGHRHGAHHSEMAMKLTQMNTVLSHVMNDFDRNDTLYVVFGDHGMNDHGDHGGDSPIEVNAALWVHSPIRLHTIRDTRNSIVDIPQIDFVPTIARLMGVPIPFGNLGAITTDMIPFTNELDVLSSLHVNAWQVHKYVSAYAEHDKTFFPSEQFMKDMHQEFDQGNNQFEEILEKVKKNGLESVEIDFIKNTSEKYEMYIRETARMCRDMWAKFDTERMTLGLSVVGVVLVTMLFYLLTSPSSSNTSVQISSILVIGLYGAIKASSLVFGTNKITSLILEHGDNAIVVIIGITLLLYWIQSILRNITSITITIDKLDLFNIICFVMYLLSIFSNSFIVYEDRIVFFMVLSNGIILVYKLRRSGTKSLILAAIYILCIRLSSETIRHRTHGTHHMADEKANSLDIVTRYCILAVPAVLPFIALSLYDKTSKWIAWLYYPIQHVLMFAYWYFRETTISSPNEPQALHITWIPRIVYILWLLATLYLLTKRNSDQWYLHLFAVAYAPLLMLKGPGYSTSFALMFVQTLLGVHIMNTLKVSSLTMVWHWWWFGLQYFFGLGQQNTVNTIQWTSGFVGLETAHLFFTGVLVGACTFAPKILYSISLPWITNTKTSRSVILYILLHAATTFVDMICVTIHRRHLMVWAIFAPKFIYDLISLAVIAVPVIFHK
jgi:phosphatidylinositol glycan class O